MFIGNEEGIALWHKLGTSEASKSYFECVRSAAQKYRSAYFTDVIEQYKKPLNNQKIFSVSFDISVNKWRIDLFHTPSSV